MEQILEGWIEKDNTLVREFEFNDFKEASTFTIILFDLYEELNHHPDTLLFGYKYLKITTTTHDSGNMLTQLDYTLAQRVNEVFDKYILN